MMDLPDNLKAVDWRVTTFAGARREQLRRWAAAPLDEVIAALEAMSEVSASWRPVSDAPRLSGDD